MGIAIDVSDSEQEKFLISHTSEVRSEEFNFCIERLRHCVRGAVVVPLLWTFYDCPQTGLPNTNNALEGLFADLKSKVRAHSGISREHRMKLLDEYIARHH